MPKLFSTALVLLAALLVVTATATAPAPLLAEEYDEVVVGAGPAGIAFATRLAQSGHKVLLLERGQNLTTDPYCLCPHFTDSTPDNEPTSKTYLQTRLAGVDYRVISFQEGATLGGCTMINGQIAIRPAIEDLNSWRDEYNLTEWNYLSLLPYYIRSENNNVPSDDVGNIPVGRDGPLEVSAEIGPQLYADLFVESLQTYLGLPANPQISVNTTKYGVGLVQKSMTRNYRRASAGTAYLPQAGPNLQVVTNAFVTKLVIEGTEVVGVQVFIGTSFYTVYARNEVVLAAGAFETPKLLILSGIGPSAQLEQFNIPRVLVQEAVGTNLIDQPGVAIINTATFADYSVPDTFDLSDNANYEEWLVNGTGPYAQTANPATSFFPSTIWDEGFDPSDPNNVNDLQLSLTARIPPYQLAVDNVYVLACFAVIPQSRGNVTLASGNPFTDPTINLNYLTNPADAVALANCLNFMNGLSTDNNSVLAQNTASRYAPDLSAIYALPPAYQTIGLEAVASAELIAGSHFSATVAMGLVLDQYLQIPGISGLRVIDISAHPTITRNNPQLTVYAVAERAAILNKKNTLPTCPLALDIDADCVSGSWVITNPNNQECVFEWTATQSGAVVSSGDFSVAARGNETVWSSESFTHVAPATTLSVTVVGSSVSSGPTSSATDSACFSPPTSPTRSPPTRSPPTRSPPTRSPPTRY